MATERTPQDVPRIDPADLKAVVDARSLELGLTRDRLARTVGVGRSTLYDWLSGAGQPNPHAWPKLAEALGLDVPELFSLAGVPLVSPVLRARLARGWSRSDLSDKTGVAFATVRQLEEGEKVRPDAAGRVAAALELDEEFVRETGRVSAPACSPLGRVLQEVRLSRGWTIAECARRLGVQRQLVSAWLLGTEPVSARRLPPLAALLGLDLAEVERLASASRPRRSPGLLGERLRTLRRQRRLSQAQLASLLEVSPTTVEQWEAGRRLPGARAAGRLEADFGVEVPSAVAVGER